MLCGNSKSNVYYMVVYSIIDLSSSLCVCMPCTYTRTTIVLWYYIYMCEWVVCVQVYLLWRRLSFCLAFNQKWFVVFVGLQSYLEKLLIGRWLFDDFRWRMYYCFYASAYAVGRKEGRKEKRKQRYELIKFMLGRIWFFGDMDCLSCLRHSSRIWFMFF